MASAFQALVRVDSVSRFSEERRSKSIRREACKVMDFDPTTSEFPEPWDEAQQTEVTAPDSETAHPYTGEVVRGPARDLSDERHLIESLRAGDAGAYAYLMETRRDRLIAVARRYFSEEEDVLDAAQEAFISVFRAIGRFEGNAALSTWLHRIVVNACLMKLRSRRRKPQQGLSPAISATLVSTSAGGAQTVLEEEELSLRVRDAIDALPELHRNVIRLRDLEDRDTCETARELVISPAAVKTRLHRARILLRAELASDVDAFARSA